jgi:phosphatidyl-myo-inositol dimannoside synthase
VPATRLEVLHPGVDTQGFQPAPRDRASRAVLGWGERPVVLTVARLQERKGHDRMLEALPAIVARQPDLVWAVVGDGAFRSALEARAAALGVADNVRFHGAVDDPLLTLAYQQCDLFVLPNREVEGDFEGFGMVLLEAQACGRAVVAGASGGTAEAMRDGETGRLVDAADPAAIAAVVGELLAQPERRRAMGERGREWATRFDWDRHTVAAVALWDRHGL